jgi:hypothetical protein
LGDRCISGTFVDTKVYSDAKDDIYAFEKNHRESYSQRVADLAVVATGEAEHVKTYIVVPPTICKSLQSRIVRNQADTSLDGRGSGLFLTLSQQIPNLIRLSIKRGYPVVIGEGKGVRLDN